VSQLVYKEVRSKNLPPKMVVNMGVSENELYPKMTILIEKHYGYPVLRKKKKHQDGTNNSAHDQ